MTQGVGGTAIVFESRLTALLLTLTSLAYSLGNPEALAARIEPPAAELRQMVEAARRPSGRAGQGSKDDGVKKARATF